eukprot:CAMPEP_0197034296 /NCGR_PEP_ID=MMETSP1384-20130603/12449_1 /TAXON_ID=29189 /ORGANISM="Ammonia sp." /LENGTH=435 /DNA_ID=CAMNT_0042464205 /DNA_START=24 /DNA_END=1331 /DNA_ORIENTATION=+
MSIEQQSSPSALHHLLPNPDHATTSTESPFDPPFLSSHRKVSELSANIHSPPSPHSPRSDHLPAVDVITKFSSHSLTASTEAFTPQQPAAQQEEKTRQASDLAPDIDPSYSVNNEFKPITPHYHKPASSRAKTKAATKYMGAQFKSPCAIFFDYLIVAIFGALYYCTEHFISIRRQCIPGNLMNNNPAFCAQSDHMNFASTPLLGFPYRSKAIPVYYPYVFGAATWWFVILISLLMQQPKLNMVKPIFIKIECLFREVLTAVMITQCTVGAIKTFVGRPRPNYYNYVDDDADDAISSFPSGHSSSSFCIHTLLVYHVMGAVYWAYSHSDADSQSMQCEMDTVHALFGAKLWQKTRDLNGFKMFVITLLMILPFYFACTRITDYYHNYSDVIAGAALGALVSTVVFVVYHHELHPQNAFYSKGVREPLLAHMSDEN